MAFVYSCCFCFSLRLGGILIGIFSLLHALLLLILFSVAHTRFREVSDELTYLLNNMVLVFTKDYFESFRDDPQKWITIIICVTCIYIVLCICYIYGAYMCNNVLMFGFILADLVRLVLLSCLIVIWLLLLKQNTMDIGLLIGASVSGGFFLLGMYYLWVCAASLPVLINEMERDEQVTTITKLRQMLEANPRARIQNIDEIPFAVDSSEPPYRNGIFTVSRNKRNTSNNNQFGTGRVPYFYN